MQGGKRIHAGRPKGTRTKRLNVGISEKSWQIISKYHNKSETIDFMIKTLMGDKEDSDQTELDLNYT